MYLKLNGNTPAFFSLSQAISNDTKHTYIRIKTLVDLYFLT